jgi:hypothetical protein
MSEDLGMKAMAPYIRNVLRNSIKCIYNNSRRKAE